MENENIVQDIETFSAADKSLFAKCLIAFIASKLYEGRLSQRDNIVNSEVKNGK